MAETLTVVAGALIDRDGRVLIAQRPEGKAMAGLWEFPGGKIMDGETPEAALVRELREELNVDTEASCLAPFAFSTTRLEQIHLLLLLFVCRKWRGIPTALEGQAFKWVHPTEFARFDMPEADRPLAVQLREFLCFNV